jgi:hypothetical protein
MDVPADRHSANVEVAHHVAVPLVRPMALAETVAQARTVIDIVGPIAAYLSRFSYRN